MKKLIFIGLFVVGTHYGDYASIAAGGGVAWSRSWCGGGAGAGAEVEAVALRGEQARAVSDRSGGGEWRGAAVVEVEQEPERSGSGDGLEPALVRFRVRQRPGPSSLDRSCPNASVGPALALQLVRVRLACRGWCRYRCIGRPGANASVVMDLAVLVGMEPVMDPLTELGTRYPGLKTEPALDLLRSVRQEQIKE